MHIKRIDLFHIAIPCSHPFETSFGVISMRPALIVRMTSDSGEVGYGESSPLYVPMSEPETVADSIPLLRAAFPRLIGLEIAAETDIYKLYADRAHPLSLVGIEAAYLDLLSRTRGIPLHEHFGGTRASISAGESIGLHDSIDEVIREVERHVSDGISRIKLKIAPNRDIDIVRAVRAKFPSLVLGADANAAYSPQDIDRMRGLGEFDLAFVEQPFSADDYESHALLRGAGIPVCLDESVRDLRSCTHAIESGACDMVNIKIARIGSFTEARAIHDLCVQKGIPLFGGGRLETGVGKTMNAHFYSLPGFTEASDITPPKDYLVGDIIAPPYEIHNGSFTLSTRPGLGITVSEDALAKFLVESFECTETATGVDQ